MLLQLTAEQAQLMEDFYQNYRQYVNDTNMDLAKRKDPAEYIDTLLDLHAPIFEQVIGRSLRFDRVTLEDVKSLAEHTFTGKGAYGTEQITEDNYKDILMDIARRSVKEVLENNPNFGFFDPNQPYDAYDVEEIKIEKPVMPTRMGGIMAGVPEQMEEYNKQLELYQKQQERIRIREINQGSETRREQRENIIDALSDRLEESRKDALYNSSKYMAVVKAMRKVNSFSDKTVDPEKNAEFLRAHQALGEACREYIETREGAKTARGNERLELIKEIYKLQKQEAEKLNDMKNELVRRSFDGKKFSDAITECRTRKVTLPESDLAASSGGTNTRYKIEVGGVRGYFSVEEEPIDVSTMEGLTKLGDKLKANNSNKEFKEEIDFIVTLMGRFSPSDRNSYLDIISTSSQKVDDTYSSDQLRAVHNINLKETGLARFHPLFGKKQDHEVAAFNKFMKSYQAEIVKADAKKTAGIEQNDEMGKRNIATSRMASLLGIGHLIAHAERMELQVGERKMTGVFMEEAVGYDVNKTDHESVLKNIETLSEPSFQKQLSAMYAFDLICGQLDRHAGNMLYKVEVRDGGNRLLGIQGIDNDLAFGTKTRLDGPMRGPFEVKHGGLAGMNNIPADFAKRLKEVKRADLDYALGDLLSKEEIDAVEIRLQQVRNHAKTIPNLTDDQWDVFTAYNDADNNAFYSMKMKEKFNPKDYRVLEGQDLPPIRQAMNAITAEREAAANHKNGILTSFFGLSAEEKAKSGKTEAQHKDKTIKEKQAGHTAIIPKDKAK